jgi:hypothetical protein
VASFEAREIYKVFITVSADGLGRAGWVATKMAGPGPADKPGVKHYHSGVACRERRCNFGGKRRIFLP